MEKVFKNFIEKVEFELDLKDQILGGKKKVVHSSVGSREKVM